MISLYVTSVSFFALFWIFIISKFLQNFYINQVTQNKLIERLEQTGLCETIIWGLWDVVAEQKQHMAPEGLLSQLCPTGGSGLLCSHLLDPSHSVLIPRHQCLCLEFTENQTTSRQFPTLFLTLQEDPQACLRCLLPASWLWSGTIRRNSWLR